MKKPDKLSPVLLFHEWKRIQWQGVITINAGETGRIIGDHFAPLWEGKFGTLDNTDDFLGQFPGGERKCRQMVTGWNVILFYKPHDAVFKASAVHLPLCHTPSTDLPGVVSQLSRLSLRDLSWQMESSQSWATINVACVSMTTKTWEGEMEDQPVPLKCFCQGMTHSASISLATSTRRQRNANVPCPQSTGTLHVGEW